RSTPNMAKLSDIRIGTKLSTVSGLGVLLVVAMIVVGMRGNAEVTGANDRAVVQEVLSRDLIDAKASIRGMQTGVRDLRLATSRDALQRAIQYIEARHNSAAKFIDTSAPKFRLPENRERTQRVRSLIDQYWAGAKEIAATKEQVFELESRGGADAAARITDLNQQAARIARERTLPLATEMEDTINKVVDVTKEQAEKEHENALSAMTSAERLSIGMGVFVVIVLIGSAIFGARSIAAPLRKMASVLSDL